MRLKLAFVMPMVLVWLAACDRAQETPPSSPSSLRQQAPLNANCSSPTAIDLVREIVTEAVETEVRAANKGLPENRRLDLSKVRALAGEIQFELLDVLTAKNDPNSTKKFCEAQLTMRVPSSTLDAANQQRKERGQVRIQTMAEDENFKIDLDKFSTNVSYSVQPTDDGKKIYVNLENAKRIQSLTTEIVVFASLNSRLAQTPQTSIQDAALNGPGASTPVTPAVVGSVPPAVVNDELTASAAAYESAEREINLIWKALPKEVRDENLPAQRAFNAEKESVCFKEASAAGEGARFEVAKNKCWTRYYQRRVPELRVLGAR